MNNKAKYIINSQNQAIALDASSFVQLANISINIITLLGIIIILSLVIIIG